MTAFDWSNKIHCKKFEDDLSRHRNIKRNWPLFKKVQWFIGIIVIPAALVVCFYGFACFYIIAKAKHTKKEREWSMREVFIIHKQVCNFIDDICLNMNLNLRSGCNKMQLM